MNLILSFSWWNSDDLHIHDGISHSQCHWDEDATLGNFTIPWIMLVCFFLLIIDITWSNERYEILYIGCLVGGRHSTLEPRMSWVLWAYLKLSELGDFMLHFSSIHLFSRDSTHSIYISLDFSVSQINLTFAYYHIKCK